MITPAELERMKTPDTTIGGYSKPKEDAHVALIDSIGNGEPFGLVPLDRRGDPDLIGLVVGGELRAEYRKVAYHPAGSGAAALILARIINEMFDRLAAIRNLNSGLKSAGAVPRSVESGPADDAPAAEFETPWAGEVEQPEPETLPNVPVEPTEPFDMPDRARTRLIVDENVADFMPAAEFTGELRPGERRIGEGWE